MVAQQNQYLNSDFISFHLSIFILLLVLFGGSGNLYGPLIGAILYAYRRPARPMAFGPAFAYGGLLLFSLYAMPNGVAGLFKPILRQGERRIEPVPFEVEAVEATQI